MILQLVQERQHGLVGQYRFLPAIAIMINEFGVIPGLVETTQEAVMLMSALKLH